MNVSTDSIRLGSVVKIRNGRRRYLVINRNDFGQLDLMALSGAERGCQPSGVSRDDVQLDADQTRAFSGKKARWLRSRCVQIIDYVFGGTTVDFNHSMTADEVAKIDVIQ